jgi:dTMP kinase
MFIVLEGLDGAGTTTQQSLLATRLRAAGYDVVTTREPTDGPIGGQIRQALRRRLTLPGGQPLDPRTIALLFAADRIDHVRSVVEPALEAGKVVLCDRYAHSSLAYQAVECPVDWVATINAHARIADLVVWVDVDVDVAMSRIERRGAPSELYEHRAFLERTRAAYARAFELRPERWVRVDGSASPEVVEAEIATQLHAHGMRIA